MQLLGVRLAMKSPTTQTPTPTDIQSHLYLSFLHGHTADVALHTKGEGWAVVYQLHRVVLIQAGFFRSLFTAGFLESQRHDDNDVSGSPLDQVNICFDDPNITRSAFEVCIARLYGGGPELYVSPSRIPTSACPLTPSFYSNTTPQIPPGHHPATPRFLLALLATSVYLSMSSITSQALSMILSTVGPHTVVRYIKFATGAGIGPSEGDDPEAAVGLEAVGEEVLYKNNSPSSITVNAKHGNNDEFDITHKLSGLEFEQSGDKDDGSSVGGTYSEEPPFNYGGIGDKVGEACACWLMRWSADILPYEEDADHQVAVKSEPSAFLRQEAGHSRRRATMSSRPHSSSQVTAPKLWARGGLSASWACAVISSNEFFIKNEWERYVFASRVINLRRRDGLDHDEEEEWAKLFQRGIHYSTMSFEELMRISQDISPVNGRPYVSMETIHSAYWQHSIFRHHIVTRSPVSTVGTGSRPPQGDKELGITVSTAEILATLSSDSVSGAERMKPYYPVPVDSSQRIGDWDNACTTTTPSDDQLLGRASDLSDAGLLRPRQVNFFGILSPHYTAASCIHADATGKARWSPYPPVRFGVEFWGVGQLAEKSRAYSHTIWYAGSLFNVYVQVVRKKGIQLGVYLHRQSSVDPMPRASVPPVTISTRAERLLNSTPAPGNCPSTPIPPPQSPPRGHISAGSSSSISSVAFAVPGSPPSSPTPSHIQPSTINAVPAPVAPLQPYRDPRSTISAHFIISCASATGSSLTRFSSSPDQFSIGQSWGWKSSSLRTEEYTEPNGEAKTRELNREASLRATVVLGLI
ncbi:hypothetical protein JB92DRAFT_2782164 [Gautieria morchelliformis]|nr:hypothetical protein JB92DRAFT_2782164 [Gautieria morchelliformis]